MKVGKCALTERRRRYWQAENWNAGQLVVPSESRHPNRHEAERAAHARLGHARLRGVRFEWFDTRDPEVRRWLAEREYLGGDPGGENR